MSPMFRAKVTLLTLHILASVQSRECHSFARSLLPKDNSPKIEKLNHLHYYFHDTVSGPNITSIMVTEAPTTNSSETSFGLVKVADEPLTEGPDIHCKLLGRAQGMFSSASQEEASLLTVFSYVFLEGKYNGSTLSVPGRNAVVSKLREMPVIRGTGGFRFARGYAQAKTFSFHPTSRNAIVEYDVYVFHY